jgi:hypothetical protein
VVAKQRIRQLETELEILATSSFFVVTNSLRLRRFAALCSDTPATPAPAPERELQAISSV